MNKKDHDWLKDLDLSKPPRNENCNRNGRIYPDDFELFSDYDDWCKRNRWRNIWEVVKILFVCVILTFGIVQICTFFR